MNTDQLLDAFESMTLADLTAFRVEFEQRFGVTAALAAAPSEQDTADDSDPDGGAEDVPVTVTLTAAGANKIQVIKAVREIVPGLGLKDAKTLVDDAPSVVLDQVDRGRADQAGDRLRAVGATVTIT